MAKKLLHVATLLVLLAGIPAFTVLAEEVLPAEPAASAAPASEVPPASAVPAASPAVPAEPAPLGPAAMVLPFTQPNTNPVLGCYAEWYCMHGGMVSCSLPGAGTCSASGAGCGLVTCGGVNTWCAGSCVGDHHCYNFCGGQANPNSYCDYGCCVCQ